MVMESSDDKFPTLAAVAARVAADRVVPFRMLAALVRLGKLTPQEALEVFDEMSAGLPDEAKEKARPHLKIVTDQADGSKDR